MANSGELSKAGDDHHALGSLLTILGWSIAAIALALALAHGTGMPAALGIGALIFLASFAAGSFLGFLFGVPRVLSKDTAPPSAPPTDAARTESGTAATPPAASARTTPSARLLQSNTNLERISDWLTTMLVGAGLVELHRVNDGLLMFRNFIAETARVFVPATPSGVATAGALTAAGPIVLVFGAAAGFLFMYLNTRLVLIRLFQSVEIELSREQLLPQEGQEAVRTFSTDSDGTSSFVGEQLTGGAGATTDDALGLMLDLLYRSNPQRVIELAGRLSQTDAVKRAQYWFYSAAAFGQVMHTEEKDSAAWVSAKDNALDCARRAVAIDASFKNRLWEISDRDSYDNDLSLLRDDPAFRRIVGR